MPVECNEIDSIMVFDTVACRSSHMVESCKRVWACTDEFNSCARVSGSSLKNEGDPVNAVSVRPFDSMNNKGLQLRVT